MGSDRSGLWCGNGTLSVFNELISGLVSCHCFPQLRDRALIVVFDTNVWKSDLYLRSAAASAVRAYLNLNDAVLGLPEVVEQEVKRHLRSDLTSYRDRLADSHRNLLAIFQNLKSVQVPTDVEIDDLINNVIDGTGLDIKRQPFTLEAARDSFLRTIEKRRPSHKNQQFKDGVLWYDCKIFAKEGPVLLVTNDRAFYRNDDPSLGLAEDLKDEIDNDELDIRIFSKLSELLNEIKKPVDLPDNRIDNDVESMLGQQLDEHVQKFGYSRSSSLNFEIEFFATEDAENLFVNISATCECEDISGAGRDNGTLEFASDGTLNTKSKNFSELSLTNLLLRYVDEEGQERCPNVVFLRAAGVTIGHKEVSF